MFGFRSAGFGTSNRPITSSNHIIHLRRNCPNSVMFYRKMCQNPLHDNVQISYYIHTVFFSKMCACNVANANGWYACARYMLYGYMFIDVYMISAWATIDPYSDCISLCVYVLCLQHRCMCGCDWNNYTSMQATAHVATLLLYRLLLNVSIIASKQHCIPTAWSHHGSTK